MLAKRFGGTQIYVPKAPTTGHPLVQALGDVAAARVAAAMAGTAIEVPLARRELACEFSRAGYTATRIARELGVSIRSVRRYLAILQ